MLHVLYTTQVDTTNPTCVLPKDSYHVSYRVIKKVYVNFIIKLI